MINYYDGIKRFSNSKFRLETDKDQILEYNSLADFATNILKDGKAGAYIQRYKGLGEMNPVQLWDTTMNPEFRTLLRIKVEDTLEADEVFSVLMGDQVEPRREFVERNALNVKNLDV